MGNKHLASLALDEIKQLKMITHNQRCNWSIYGSRITLYLIENVSMLKSFLYEIKILKFLILVNKIILFSAVICNFLF